MNGQLLQEIHQTEDIYVYIIYHEVFTLLCSFYMQHYLNNEVKDRKKKVINFFPRY